MPGIIWEFFGYRATDTSDVAKESAVTAHCPFLGERCTKNLSDGLIAGACTLKLVNSGPVICCPVRLYAEDYKVLHDVSDLAFGPDIELMPGASAVQRVRQTGKQAVAVFGKRWGGELRVPQKGDRGGYFVDWVLALINSHGHLQEFVAVEVQTMDTTGNYRPSRAALLERRAIMPSTVGFNWENVNKRILSQLVYKGQVLQREDLCNKGLFFVCPEPVYHSIANRLGGISALAQYPFQPASITFMAYDLDDSQTPTDGVPVPLVLKHTHSTTVYKLQEAFNNVTLPQQNVYKSAILNALS